MSFLSRKRKVGAEEFCAEFFDQFMFPPLLAGIDVWRTGIGFVYYNTILEADESWAVVDRDRFCDELLMLRIEIFGIAWMHNVSRPWLLAESLFLKTYLQAHALADMWESLSDYNQAVARSAISGWSTDDGQGRANIGRVNYLRVEYFDTLFQPGDDPVPIARTANRLETERSWKQSRTQAFLLYALTRRLQREGEVNDEARIRIIYMLQGFHDGASQAMKAVDISAP